MKNFWKKIKIPILALAPMAGFTNSPFRLICKGYGADVVYSEMASAAALCYKNEKTLELLKFSKSERPYIVQVFGNDPKYFRNAARIITEKIRPDGIDINMGCPVKKVFGDGSGAALMDNIEKAREIIKETLKGTRLPVSIKIRSRVGKTTAYKFVKRISDLPISAIMIHGRSLSQGFAGDIDYSGIKKVKFLCQKETPKEAGLPIGSPVSCGNIPIIANGGIYTPEDAETMLQKTGADGIGIARGALIKPWIFSQIREYFGKGKYEEFNLKEIRKAALRHAKVAYKFKGEWGIVEMRKHLLWYFQGFEGAKEMRKRLVKVENLRDLKRILKL